jgi:hypothetical protein
MDETDEVDEGDGEVAVLDVAACASPVIFKAIAIGA